jgi:hypothetical protein
MGKNSRTILNIALIIALILFILSLIPTIPYLKNALDSMRAPKGPVKVAKTHPGWRLTVGGRPFFVRGVVYEYVPIGKGLGYDIFADPNKPWLTDGPLMKKMGVNAVRFYKAGKDPNQTRQAIRDLYRNFGIKSALGHYLGYWDWPPPNYADPQFQNRMKEEIVEMVKAYKDEEGLLFWILGNENNYAFDRGERDWSTPEIDALNSPIEERKAKAKIYYTFINDLAKAIKGLDKNHPVVMGNGELTSIGIAKECCPDVDILGGIVYQGKSFGTYFERLERNLAKPNVFIEYGADRYDAVWQQEAPDWQAFFLKLQTMEIYKNRAGGEGTGNSLGGFAFEWSDEWWKHNPSYDKGWKVHDNGASWSNSAYYYDAKAGNNMEEEWWGLVSFDPKHMKNGQERRIPTKAYYVMQSLFTENAYSARKKFVPPTIFFLILVIGLGIARLRANR